MRTTKSATAAALLPALALAACNETGSMPQERASAAALPVIEGAYGGFLSGARIDYYRMLLDGSELWLAYGVDTAAGFQASGFYHASGAVTEGLYTGISAVEYLGERPAGSGTARAVHDAQAQPLLLQGSFTIDGNQSLFSAGPISGANFDFHRAADSAALAGTWQVTDLRAGSHSLVVGASGSFTLDAGAPCSATGAFIAQQDRNAYAASIQFGAGCPAHLQGRTLGGAAFIYAYANSPSSLQLIAMFRDIDGDAVGYVLNGVR